MAERAIRPDKTRTADVRQELAKTAGARPMSVRTMNALTQRQNRWQRAVRYTWDKKKG